MKFRKWEIILFPCLLVVAILFSLIQTYWSGFSYFSASVFFVIIIFFINNRIYNLKNLKIYYDENLETYFVDLYNKGLISREQFENVDQQIVNGYYSDYRRFRNLTILMVVIFAFIVIGVILVVFNLW